MSTIPKLDEIQLRQKYDSGDRIIIRTSEDLSFGRMESLKRSISKSFNEPLRVLTVNCLRMEINLKRGSYVENLAGVSDFQNKSPVPGTINVSCGKIKLEPQDQVYVKIKWKSDVEKRETKARIRDWVGDIGVEVIYVEDD